MLAIPKTQTNWMPKKRTYITVTMFYPLGGLANGQIHPSKVSHKNPVQGSCQTTTTHLAITPSVDQLGKNARELGNRPGKQRETACRLAKIQRLRLDVPVPHMSGNCMSGNRFVQLHHATIRDAQGSQRAIVRFLTSDRVSCGQNIRSAYKKDMGRVVSLGFARNLVSPPCPSQMDHRLLGCLVKLVCG